jgi:hypothetical protein
MVTIFSEAKLNRDAPRYLEQDVQRLVQLCDNFLESAKTDRGARDSEDAIFRMKEHDLNLRSTLAEYEDFKVIEFSQCLSMLLLTIVCSSRGLWHKQSPLLHP